MSFPRGFAAAGRPPERGFPFPFSGEAAFFSVFFFAAEASASFFPLSFPGPPASCAAWPWFPSPPPESNPYFFRLPLDNLHVFSKGSTANQTCPFILYRQVCFLNCPNVFVHIVHVVFLPAGGEMHSNTCSIPRKAACRTRITGKSLPQRNASPPGRSRRHPPRDIKNSPSLSKVHPDSV